MGRHRYFYMQAPLMLSKVLAVSSKAPLLPSKCNTDAPGWHYARAYLRDLYIVHALVTQLVCIRASLECFTLPHGAWILSNRRQPKPWFHKHADAMKRSKK